MSEPAVDDALVAELARSAVSQAAPEELPLFRATSEAYFENPEALAAERSGDDMLGFGVGEAAVLLTPVALAVSRDVLNFVLEQLRAQAREHGAEAIDRLVSRLLKRDGEPAPEALGDACPPDLSEDQLKEVRALAVEKARQLKLAPDKAELLADSLVGSLATA